MIFRILTLNYISNCVSSSYRKLFWNWVFAARELRQVITEHDPLDWPGLSTEAEPLGAFNIPCPSNRWKNIRKTQCPPCEKQRSRTAAGCGVGGGDRAATRAGHLLHLAQMRQPARRWGPWHEGPHSSITRDCGHTEHLLLDFCKFRKPLKSTFK